ncbi:MAG: hypothetical protein HWN65_15405 [Candidatus Helarchaeota archaeon]|nr:hypothetical protein [Candidatus Helarchaeota archaeon]
MSGEEDQEHKHEFEFVRGLGDYVCRRCGLVASKEIVSESRNLSINKMRRAWKTIVDKKVSNIREVWNSKVKGKDLNYWERYKFIEALSEKILREVIETEEQSRKSIEMVSGEIKEVIWDEIIEEVRGIVANDPSALNKKF